MTNLEDSVPEVLPAFAEFSPPFSRGGYTYLIWADSQTRWTVRRFYADDHHEDIGHLVKMDEATYGYVHVGDGIDVAAKSPSWRELVTLYT